MNNKSVLNRRECLSYLFLLGLFLQIFIFVSISIAYAMPKRNLFNAGVIANIPPSFEPTFVRETGYQNGLWLVNDGTNIYAFSWRTPDQMNCIFAWSSVTERFEDPCSGSKFTLDGHYIEGPAWRKRLDQYPVIIEGEQLQVDLSHVIQGDPVFDLSLPFHQTGSLCGYNYYYKTIGFPASSPSWQSYQPTNPERRLVKEPVYCP